MCLLLEDEFWNNSLLKEQEHFDIRKQYQLQQSNLLEEFNAIKVSLQSTIKYFYNREYNIEHSVSKASFDTKWIFNKSKANIVHSNI